MSGEFLRIKQSFDSEEWNRDDVLNAVIFGHITFDEYRMITDPNYKEPIKREIKPPEPTMGRIERVRSNDTDWYEWCELLKNGTLAFGSEQGNYAGGMTLSYQFYGERNCTLPIDHPISDKYLSETQKRLSCEREINYEFYQKIVDMCKRNNAAGPLGIIAEIEEGAE